MTMLVRNGIKSIIQKGGLGASPLEAEEIFKKSNKMEAFPLFFFAFWQGSLHPQNYELAP